MESADSAIESSISCYRELLAEYSAIREAIASGAPAETLYERLDRAQELFEQAKKQDAGFQAEAAGAGVMLEDLPGVSEWRALVEKARDESRGVIRHIKAAMAVAGQELSRLDSGRRALSGYKSGRSQAGKRIDIRSV